VRLEMKRPAKQITILCWPPWAVIAVLLTLPVIGLTCSDEGWTARFASNQPEDTKQFPMVRSSTMTLTALEELREASFVHGLMRELLDSPTINPGIGSKLDLCAEFSKPDSLKIRLMGTPKNHRSPPA